MSQKYLHFTNLADADKIKRTGELWQSSYGPMGAVFAVAIGGAWVPSVQMSSMGRAKIRSAAVIFETKYLPDGAWPEEVMWHLGKLPINVVNITTPSKVKDMLDSSIEEDNYTEQLKVKIHPAFNNGGDWTRMPEDFSYWVPGEDNNKYMQASTIWDETKNVEKVREFWESNSSDRKIKDFIGFLTDEELEKH